MLRGILLTVVRGGTGFGTLRAVLGGGAGVGTLRVGGGAVVVVVIAGGGVGAFGYSVVIGDCI